MSLALIHLVLSFSAVSVRGPVNFLLKTQGDFHLPMSNFDVELSLEVLEEKSLPSSLQVLRKWKGHLGRLGRRLCEEGVCVCVCVCMCVQAGAQEAGHAQYTSNSTTQSPLLKMNSRPLQTHLETIPGLLPDEAELANSSKEVE